MNYSIYSHIIDRGWVRARVVLVAVVVGLLVAGYPPRAGAVEREVPVELAATVIGAAAAWGEFAATGDLDAIEPWFAADGPQWRRFQQEATNRTRRQSLRFEVRELRLRRVTSTRSTVWARVTVDGDGLVPVVFGWDFDLVHRNGRWRVWTVVTAERPDPAEMATEQPSPAASPTTTSAPVSMLTSPPTSTSTTVPLTRPAADNPPLEPVVAAGPVAPPTAAGVRLPALSAWIIVITVAAVVAAGYLAPRLERRTGS